MERIEQHSEGLRKGERTRARILRAAGALFAARGFAATPLREVAQAVGLREPSLYNHFPSKEALYVAVLEEALRPLLEKLHGTLDREGNRRELPEAMLALLAEHPEVARLMTQELLRGGGSLDPILGRWMRSLLSEGLAASLPLGRDDAERMLTVIAMFNLTVGYVALAPAFAALTGLEVTGEAALERQRRLVRRIAKALRTEEEVSS